jgi:hypothetical protein
MFLHGDLLSCERKGFEGRWNFRRPIYDAQGSKITSLMYSCGQTKNPGTLSNLGMKTGLAISTLLSGVVFAVLIGSMQTCQRSMVMDPQRKLVEPMPPGTPPATPRKTYSWEQLHPFEDVEPRILPGDRLDYFETRWSLPYLVRVE